MTADDISFARNLFAMRHKLKAEIGELGARAKQLEKTLRAVDAVIHHRGWNEQGGEVSTTQT